MSELTKEKIYKKELEKVGGEGNNNLERIRSLAGGGVAAFEDIVDKNGNKRFIDGNGTNIVGNSMNATYNKWSLSGTHLMIVLAFTANTTIGANSFLASYTLPDYITDKIVPSSFNDYVEIKSFTSMDSSKTNISFDISKLDNVLRIRNFSNITADKVFRIQFDLLIDTE